MTTPTIRTERRQLAIHRRNRARPGRTQPCIHPLIPRAAAHGCCSTPWRASPPRWNACTKKSPPPHYPGRPPRGASTRDHRDPGLPRDTRDQCRPARGCGLVTRASAGRPAGGATFRRGAAGRGGLNGVCGDHLEASDNPLAIAIAVAHPQERCAPGPRRVAPGPARRQPHVVVLVHGLCLSEQCWGRRGNTSIGERLRDDFGFTPLYLRYNTGRHISTNGRQLAGMLNRLCGNWPVPVQSLSLVGHSMGGLVIRSACQYARETQESWPQLLQGAWSAWVPAPRVPAGAGRPRIRAVHEVRPLRRTHVVRQTAQRRHQGSAPRQPAG